MAYTQAESPEPARDQTLAPETKQPHTQQEEEIRRLTMSNEIQPLNQFTDEERALVQQMGLTDVPPAHIKTFLHIAQSMHLDPKLKRDIALITRNSKNGPTYTVQVGIAGYRKAARKIAKAEGETIQVDPWLFKGSDSDWVDVWDSQNGTNPPLAAKCTVYRDGMPFTQVVMWSEFVQMYNGKPQALWASKPSYMLGKTAESLAWRQAFPDEMGNTYEESEVEALHSTRMDRPADRGADMVRQALAEKKQQPQPGEDAKHVEQAKPTVEEITQRALAAIAKAETDEKLSSIMDYASKQNLDQDVLDMLADKCGERAQEVGIV